MDFPIKNGGSFHSYVKLPEGTSNARYYELRAALQELFLSIHHDPSPTEGHDCSCGGGGGDAPWRHVFADMIWHDLAELAERICRNLRYFMGKR